MPSRNVNKPNVPDAYYHVYFRGAGKQVIFRDDADYHFFLSLFGRHLSCAEKSSPFGIYPHLRGTVEILSFCLMTNHVHLLLYQAEADAMSRLMRSILTSYSRYFNKKYKRSGPLFETRYKASMVSSDTYLLHITRYIHMNPRYWKRYRRSSLRYYTGHEAPEWLQLKRILPMLPVDYLGFCEEYQENKDMLERIKLETAD